MGKKTPFIDKKKAVTFRLTPTVDTKPPIVGNPELVNVVPITDEELVEREKFGIYYADNYNYMSHLKARDELSAFHLVEKTAFDAPQSSSKVATNIVEIKGREIPLNIPAQWSSTNSLANIDGADEIDPEILEMLNEEETEDFGDEGELEDDFLNLAGGLDLPEGRRVYEEFRKNTQMSDSDLEDEEDGFDDNDKEMMNEDEDAKPHSILKIAHQANPDKKEMDERFNEFYEQMDNDDSDSEEVEDEEELVDDALLENFADEYHEDKNRPLCERPDDESKELSLRAYVQQESGRPEETEHIELEVRTKRTKWDCESIATTYSNIYNHPTVIREAPKRKINPNKKKAKEQPMEVEGEEQMECESVKTTRSICSVARLRGETTEERRERKRAVKEERRERRVDKKTLKEMFKEEKKAKDAQKGHVYVSGHPISQQ